MSQDKKNVTVWIPISYIKRALIGLALVAVIAGVAAYEVPASKVWNYWGLPLAGQVIALDAGHGGVDGGAVSKQGVIEKDINLAVTLYLRDYLQQAGAVVVLTREDDRDLANPDTKGYSKRKTEDLQQRLRFIQGKEAKLFVSIHMNSIPSERWSGAQTFYPKGNQDGSTLADLVQQELRRNLENTDRVAKSADHIYLLQSLKIPSILVEVGFLSHPAESKLLADQEYQRKVASSIYKGILRYSSGEKPSSSTDSAS
ncbi:N-acetylmuramoyl-L-alanine amidase CwlD [Paenibacillus sp. J22TS3]|uniref:N-acetylmuramoyl-L-alanine amidase CwlD n=1 Tax=Paenibacillus sp. J22TS3 TaxID=2807192 RepID=UPI001B1D0261|nr:N-acetylmuramoyl-L-alanine amidase CwlD [Paenibacillus sp. J22TS3]GIP24724.1 germination-specific N-acetylmuramoyl-L-alanine amidase [Paenibacillus sp. J22TS3]